MQGSTVRIDEEAREILREIAEKENESMTRVLRKALEDYRRKLFLKSCADAYSNLDEKAWNTEKAEREEWEETLGDGPEGER